MPDKKINIFAINLDENTKKQFDHCCEQDFVLNASLMPDAHSGYVAPIGSVFLTRDYVVPSWVGYDIGCGMIACKFTNKELVQRVRENSKNIYDMVNTLVPMGQGNLNHIKDISNKTKEDFKLLLRNFENGEHKKEILTYLNRKALSHLGTLGSGNHFIELGELNNELWLIVHSGSRGVGHTVATHYMKVSSGKEKGFEATHPLDLNSQEGKEYMNILDFGLEFALLNRLEMAYKVRDVIREVLNDKNIDFELWTNKNHNHAIFVNDTDKRQLIHRKGATPAKNGERGVIPANMRDGCFLVEGLGNNEFLESSSHGAGRKMSRIEAKKNITMKEFKDSMQGITATIHDWTIDEAPQAYKDIYEVMEAQKKSVNVLGQVKPIINWKGK